MHLVKLPGDVVFKDKRNMQIASAYKPGDDIYITRPILQVKREYSALVFVLDVEPEEPNLQPLWIKNIVNNVRRLRYANHNYLTRDHLKDLQEIDNRLKDLIAIFEKEWVL